MRWSVLLITALLAGAAPGPESFQFVILGDRTGDNQPGVYEQAWREAAGEQPAFVVSVGDSIEGMDDAKAEMEWRQVWRIVDAYRRIPFYPAPGNHDIWSEVSQRLFRKYAGQPLHYSFDYRSVHCAALDNSRSEQFSPEELAFLEKDLAAHAGQPVKVIVSHRPSWLMDVLLRNPDFPLHRLAKKYGVRYVVAGHVHKMLRLELEGVTYLSMPSSGGHLRASGRYEDGWFFGYAVGAVRGSVVGLRIKELPRPNGLGRVSRPEDWGAGGREASSARAE
jgi:hypothetical protein